MPHSTEHGGHGEGVMDLLRELLAIDDRQALAFFVQHLQEVSESSVDRQELLYTASLLAHFAQVSTQSEVDWSAPTNLGALFDYFVSDAARLDNGQVMEMAGAQCLLLAGFFEDQMRRRYNIRWYAKLGAGFFSRAALQERSPDKARLLDAIAIHFEPWRRRCAQLGRELRDQPYLLVPLWPPMP
jgi:hypothetical protein